MNTYKVQSENTASDQNMTSELKKIQYRIVRAFMDILILSVLTKKKLSGYDLIALIHDRFQIMISSGTVYSKLYAMERQGLITGSARTGEKRFYTITEKGTKIITELQRYGEQGMIKELFKILEVNNK